MPKRPPVVPSLQKLLEATPSRPLCPPLSPGSCWGIHTARVGHWVAAAASRGRHHQDVSHGQTSGRLAASLVCRHPGHAGEGVDAGRSPLPSDRQGPGHRPQHGPSLLGEKKGQRWRQEGARVGVTMAAPRGHTLWASLSPPGPLPRRGVAARLGSPTSALQGREHRESGGWRGPRNKASVWGVSAVSYAGRWAAARSSGRGWAAGRAPLLVSPLPTP